MRHARRHLRPPLGDDSRHANLARRLLGKLVDGQVRQKGDLDGLWGPVCVNYGYYGKLFTLGQTLRQELDVTIPKKLEQAPPGQQEQIVKLGQEMKQVYDGYEQTYRDVFRCGTRMLEIRLPYAIDDRNIVPGMPLNAYQWVVTDIESTEAAALALAEAKRAGLLPKETERLAIRGKKIHPPVKTDAAIRAAAKRLAAAVDDDGGAKAMAMLAANTGFEKTGYPAPAFAGKESLPPLFDVETACTCVAADAAIESLVAAEPDLAEQVGGPRKRARDRAARIAERWYAESADPAAEAWKGMYWSWKVSHADLKESPVLPVPDVGGGEVESLPWGPVGSLYRIVPGFRSLFAAVGSAKDRFADDLFRRVAYRLVALQDSSGQWSSPGNVLVSTASESLMIHRVADQWHRLLSQDPPVTLQIPDPLRYETMLITDGTRYGGWVSNQAARPDAAVYPTLASLLFLLDGVEGPVSLDGIQILPDETPEPPKESADGQPPPRLTPPDAARKVVRPSLPREELRAALIASRWPRRTGAAEPSAADEPASKAPDGKPMADESAEEQPAEDDGLGKFEDLLTPDAAKR
ncbi:MAG: hypothetical protein EBZ59_08060 [Planctomycetia bacterium]|nr:hypothetical protein [Planctomycetia bacterium]